MAAYLNLQTGSNEIFVHLDGRNVEQLSADPQASWGKRDIKLEALDRMIEFNAVLPR